LGEVQNFSLATIELVPMHEFRATTQNFGPAIIELDAAMRAGRLRHGRQPCAHMVHRQRRRQGGEPRRNLYPTKSRRDQKIDAAMALIMAIGRAVVEDEQTKGLDGFLANPIFG
jgi:phage terminase large subunit-like protein